MRLWIQHYAPGFILLLLVLWMKPYYRTLYYANERHSVTFAVITAVTIRNSVFWDVIPFGPKNRRGTGHKVWIVFQRHSNITNYHAQTSPMSPSYVHESHSNTKFHVTFQFCSKSCVHFRQPLLRNGKWYTHTDRDSWDEFMKHVIKTGLNAMLVILCPWLFETELVKERL
jgi:hypothetical protein